MTHLEIKNQNSNVEIVDKSLISKLYQEAKTIKDYEDLNDVLESLVDLSGNLQVDKAYGDEVDWLNNTFANLHINITTSSYLKLSDDEFLRIILAKGIGDGYGVTATDLSGVTVYSGDISRWIYNGEHLYNAGTELLLGNTAITNLSGLQYFTGLTSISGRFAKGCTNLTTVITPPNITSLSDPGGGDQSFMGVFRECTSLTNVTLNEGLISILCRCFKDCTSLLTLNIPSTVTTIGVFAFHQCTALQTITGTSNVNSIGLYAFSNCSVLRTLPNWSPITIGIGTFSGCSMLTTFDTSNLTNIPYNSFKSCSSLISVDLSSCTSMNSNAFLDCTSLSSVTLGSNLTLTDSYIFYGCSALATIDLSHLTSILRYSFYNCSSLTSVNLSNCTLIGPSGFQGCSSLTSLSLSQLCTELDSLAFMNCTSLTSLGDISNVTTWYNSVFYNCSSLGTDLTFEFTHNGTNNPSGVVSKTQYKRVIAHMPNLTHYDDRYPFYESMSKLEYLDMSDCAFDTVGSTYGASKLTTIILPSSITTVTYRCLEGLSLLQYFIILAETPPTANNNYNFTTGTNGTNADIYVKDSTVRDLYLANSNWNSIPNASTRIKTFAELPAGVWTTGLASLYLTPAQLATS